MDAKLSEVVAHAEHLKAQYRERDLRMKKMDDMYWMRWDEQTDVEKKIETYQADSLPRSPHQVESGDGSNIG